MRLPVLSAEELQREQLDEALRGFGGFLLRPSVPSSLSSALAAAHRLFALPRAEKAAWAIERSPHFRGWSELHNERDWREQLHLARERPALEGSDHRRLEGPNLWPADEGWRRALTAYLDATTTAGERIVDRLLPVPRGGPDGYVVMKLIGYHPQAPGGPARPGVAAHVDFSLLTLTLQDSPGLEIRTPAGEWLLVEPQPDAVWVHPGELLELASGGRYLATPHRVVNRSLERTRVSIPVFLNPPLEAIVPAGPRGYEAREGEHVHRVLAPGDSPRPLHFGAAEWRRKGLDGWCHQCAPGASSSGRATGSTDGSCRSGC